MIRRGQYAHCPQPVHQAVRRWPTSWRGAIPKKTNEHSAALRLTELLAAWIGLETGTDAYQAIQRFPDEELGANPGRFAMTDEPQKILTQLLREDVGGFQRMLSPLLSEGCYERYQVLLDSLRIGTAEGLTTR